MRTTIKALLCSVTVAACAPIGERGDGVAFGPDAGVDGSTASGTCDNLETRTLDLAISGTAGFTNLPTGCWKLNGKLTLTGPAVTSVAKLGDLREVRDLVIDDTELTKLDSKSPIEVSGTITIRSNEKLTDITNVVAKPTVAAIVVEHNAALTGLGGLAKASVVTGETRIGNNAKLAIVDLGTVTRFEGGLTVQDNPVLESLDLHSASSAGSLALRRNPALTSIQLTGLQYVHGSLTVDDNDNLTALSGLSPNLTVDVGVSITNNQKLASLGPLARASYVGGAVVVSSNSALDLTAAHEIDCCVNTGPVSISNNRTTTCSGNHWCLANQDACPF